MSVLTTACTGALIIGVIGLLAYRREEEKDRAGNLCVRFLGPRFAMPVVPVAWVAIGLLYLKHPLYPITHAHYVLIIALTFLTLIGAICFVSYRITLFRDHLEFRCWPLPPRKYPLAEMTAIRRGRLETTLEFQTGEPLKIACLLSGEKRFMERLRRLRKAAGQETVE